MAAPDRGLVSTLLLKVLQALCHLSMRIEVQGLPHLNVNSAAIVVFNHLSLADGPIVASLLPRKGVFLVAREFAWIPILNWCLRKVGDPIYINRGVPDRRALRRAIAVLEGGGLLCLAPEGRVSPTGALTEAQDGAAFMGRLASAIIIPVAAYGQEKFWRAWLRLRRPHVRVIVGRPFDLPSDQNRDNTRALMRRIAELLPSHYRGCYDAER
jgi:1-acyl-sn-glycerol-3-phosphate acyltransferase